MGNSAKSEPRRKPLPYDEFVDVVEDPHRGGKLVGRRGFIDGHAQTGERPHRYWIKLRGIKQPLPFARAQLAPTGVPILVFPPRPWSLEQIERVTAEPGTDWSSWLQLLNTFARVSDVCQVLRTSSNSRVRSALCYYLCSERKKSGREAVLAALFDPDAHVRFCAADNYPYIGRAEDGPIVLAAYRLERNDKVLGCLVLALGAIQYQAAAPFLIKHLKTRRHLVFAIESLGELKGEAVLAALYAELETNSDPGWIDVIRDSIDLVEARARRDAAEAAGLEIERPLKAADIERLVLERAPSVRSVHMHLRLFASEIELKKVIKSSVHREARNAAEFALPYVRERAKRGY